MATQEDTGKFVARSNRGIPSLEYPQPSALADDTGTRIVTPAGAGTVALSSDDDVVGIDSTAGIQTAILPPLSSVVDGKSIVVSQLGASVVTIAATAGDDINIGSVAAPLDGSNNLPLTAVNDSAEVRAVKDGGTETWIIAGTNGI